MKLPLGLETDFATLKDTSWREWGVRFLFGGVISVAAAVVGSAYGPVVGGLLLAFPAILPAALTLVADRHGRHVAGADANGAIIGSLALAAFGAVVWLLAPAAPAWQVLAAAAVTWFVVAIGGWVLCRGCGLLAALQPDERARGEADARERGAA
jgi:hypothetical protein